LIATKECILSIIIRCYHTDPNRFVFLYFLHEIGNKRDCLIFVLQKITQMNLFYAPDLHESSQSYVFDKDESRHISKVLRKRAGEELFLTNGKGLFFTAEILDNHPKKTQVKIIKVEKKNQDRPLIHMAVAPTKSNDRFEWFLEKATEIGIHRITPLLTVHSERKKINPERYEKILVSAMKQSLKAYKPSLSELTKFHDFVTRDFGNVQKFIAYCKSEQNLSATVNTDNVLVLVGPEGGFSQEEIALAQANGFAPVALSAHRLRTETAALMAVATVHVCSSGKL